MKTKLPHPYSNLDKFNYDLKLANGLYFTINPKLIKLNYKNYSIISKEEITFCTNSKISIISIRASIDKKIQYLVTKDIFIKEIYYLSFEFLPEDFRDYILIAYESIMQYDILKQNN